MAGKDLAPEPAHSCSYTTPSKQVHTRFTALKLKNLYIKQNPTNPGFTACCLWYERLRRQQEHDLV